MSPRTHEVHPPPCDRVDDGAFGTSFKGFKMESSSMVSLRKVRGVGEATRG